MTCSLVGVNVRVKGDLCYPVYLEGSGLAKQPAKPKQAGSRNCQLPANGPVIVLLLS